MTDEQIAYLEYFVKFYGPPANKTEEQKQAEKTDVKGCWY